MSGTRKHRYSCEKCGQTIEFYKKLSFCPFCGSSDIHRDTEKSERRAKEIIEEMQAIIPEIKDAWNRYVELYAEFENRRRVLDAYVRRDIINKEMIPKYEKQKLIDALYEYRAKRKEDRDGIRQKNG